MPVEPDLGEQHSNGGTHSRTPWILDFPFRHIIVYCIRISSKRCGPAIMESLIAPKTLVDQAYAVILDAISDGTLKPGERLTQDSVAQRLNVRSEERRVGKECRLPAVPD